MQSLKIYSIKYFNNLIFQKHFKRYYSEILTNVKLYY